MRFVQRVQLAVVLLLASAVALAQVATPDDPAGFVQLLVDAALHGRWPVAVALVLVALVWAIRKLVAPKVPFFGTGAGGAVLNIATSFSVALATPLLAGVTFTWALLWVALQASLTAAGGFSLLKYLLPLIPGVAGIFARGDAAAEEAKAKAAGLAAANVIVAKQPSSDQIANGP
jgi:hypothetical protein